MDEVSSTDLGKRASPVLDRDGDAVVRSAAQDLQTWTTFETIYDRCHNPIYQFCLRRLGNRQDAEDATQEIFFGALKSFPQLKGEDARPWLFGIARNVVTSHWRRYIPIQSLDDAFELHDPAPNPEDRALAAEMGQDLRRLLAHLPADDRDVIELRLAGLTSAEIGAILERKPGAVDTAHCRAIKRLKRILGLGKEGRDGCD